MSEEKTINYITKYIKELCGIDDSVSVPLSAVQLVVEQWKALGRKPTADEIVEQVWARQQCGCLDHIAKSLCLEIFKLLMTFKPSDRWNCNAVLLVHNYYLMEKTWPTWPDIERMYNSMMRINANPEQYSQDNKVLVGFSIESHKTTVNTTEKCSMCLSELSKDVYKLPCGHMFHSKGSECLGESVEKWFRTNTKCPLCRHDIREPVEQKK